MINVAFKVVSQVFDAKYSAFVGGVMSARYDPREWTYPDATLRDNGYSLTVFTKFRDAIWFVTHSTPLSGEGEIWLAETKELFVPKKGRMGGGCFYLQVDEMYRAFSDLEWDGGNSWPTGTYMTDGVRLIACLWKDGHSCLQAVSDAQA